MLIPNHPADERLSALAWHDPDAIEDASLGAHVSSCARCAATVAELGHLRASLAELPDIAPSRPLRLLPEMDDAAGSGDRIGGWARRFFAPLLTAGAALAIVGLVGTAAPVLDDVASGAASGLAPESEAAAMRQDHAEEAAQPSAASAEGGGDGGVTAAGDGGSPDVGDPNRLLDESAGAEPQEFSAGAETDGERDAASDASIPAERSPWPMVLFTGVAILVGAALLRWILVPRAG